MIRDGEAGRQGARSRKVTFTLDNILTLKGLNSLEIFVKFMANFSIWKLFILLTLGLIRAPKYWRGLGLLFVL